jgi:surfactin synthase thioesterase subunit
MSWFLSPLRRPEAAVRLYCLPYAGGGASAFREWPAAIGSGVEVHAVALPGRESRFGEGPDFDIAELADALAAHTDTDGRPFALYGHSLGGVLGFEVIRRLRHAGGRLPVRFYVGASRPPHIRAPGRFMGLSRLDDAELIERVGDLGGVPEAVLAEPELMELLLPVLRADFARIDAYRYEPGPPIEVPIVAFAGRSDTVVPITEVRAWSDHTGAGFRLEQLPGDHFFLRHSREALLGALRADLLAAVTARKGG